MLHHARRKQIQSRAIDQYADYPLGSGTEFAADDVLALLAHEKRLRLMLKLAREGLIEIKAAGGESGDMAALTLECIKEVVTGG